MRVRVRILTVVVREVGWVRAWDLAKGWAKVSEEEVELVRVAELGLGVVTGGEWGVWQKRGESREFEVWGEKGGEGGRLRLSRRC